MLRESWRLSRQRPQAPLQAMSKKSSGLAQINYGRQLRLTRAYTTFPAAWRRAHRPNRTRPLTRLTGMALRPTMRLLTLSGSTHPQWALHELPRTTPIECACLDKVPHCLTSLCSARGRRACEFKKTKVERRGRAQREGERAKMINEAIRTLNPVENRNASKVSKLRRIRVFPTQGSRRLEAWWLGWVVERHGEEEK